MQTETRFTLKGNKDEIPFSIIEKGDKEYVLLSLQNGVKTEFKLINDNGLFELEHNPFEEDYKIVKERLVGMSSDWIESKSQGFDPTVESFEKISKPGYGPDDIFVENKPFSLKNILDLIEGGDIELTPDFQRNFIWDKTRQSKLIESILLGLPLPSIYLSQYEDGRLTVVDGLQRLSTIRAFLKDELKLINLEYLKECNGKKFSELNETLSPLRLRRFGQTQVMCFVIDYRSPSQLKFDLFKRLNTGGKPLNNQEIRNCLSHPKVQKILKGMVELESFGLATDWSVKDDRMDAREAALRFMYFNDQYSELNPLGQYNGDMESTLDNHIDELNKRDSENLEKYIKIYDNALKNAHFLFGSYCFRKILPSSVGKKRSPINKLLMLTMSVLLTKYDHIKLTKICNHESLVEPLAKLIDSEKDLFEAITYGTNGKWNLHIGFSSFKKLLENQIKGI